MKRLLYMVLILCVSFSGYAQDKNSWHYMDHQDEILPDAKDLFKRGEYRRVLDLCDLYMDLKGETGSEAKDITSLREIALKALVLADDMADKLADGKKDEAIDLALLLKEINPDDARTRIADPEPVEVPEIVAPQPFRIPNRFFVKPGASFFGIGSEEMTLALELGAGLYNIGGSRFGVEVKGFLNTALNDSSTLMYGGDVRLAFRIGQRLYPSVGIGFFSCDDKDGKAVRPTAGIFVPVGISWILGKGLTLEAGVSIFPSVRLFTGFTNEPNWYGVPQYKDVVSSPVVPGVSIGYAF